MTPELEVKPVFLASLFKWSALIATEGKTAAGCRPAAAMSLDLSHLEKPGCSEVE